MCLEDDAIPEISISTTPHLKKMKKRRHHKTISTKRNEYLLKIIKRLVDKCSNCKEEIKLAIKLLIDETLVAVKNRHIARYHDLIDYLRGKTEFRIEHNEELSQGQKFYRKVIVRLISELAKHWSYIRKPFWPGKRHGRIVKI